MQMFPSHSYSTRESEQQLQLSPVCTLERKEVSSSNALDDWFSSTVMEDNGEHCACHKKHPPLLTWLSLTVAPALCI